MRVALATCAEIPELEPDDRLLLPALADHGIEGVPAVWDDAAVAWDAFDLVVLRSTWDYAERRDEFLAWARSLRRVENPVPLLEWNTDKRYLEQLAAAGVPTVPTRFVAPRATFEPPAEPFVVKPSVSAGGRSSAMVRPGRRGRGARARRAIHAEGRTAMIQPYLAGAEEKALVYVDGGYSHALLRRVPLPAAGARPVLYLEEELAPAEASVEERKIAEAALACAPGEPLYARVDLLGGAVLELELTEPSLYFGSVRAAPSGSHRPSRGRGVEPCRIGPRAALGARPSTRLPGATRHPSGARRRRPGASASTRVSRTRSSSRAPSRGWTTSVTRGSPSSEELSTS